MTTACSIPLSYRQRWMRTIWGALLILAPLAGIAHLGGWQDSWVYALTLWALVSIFALWLMILRYVRRFGFSTVCPSFHRLLHGRIREHH